jgi:menaquinone-dependent protoporphyrinogen oxidase
MKVLVDYASRHGSTAGIAERIAAGLREAGLSAEARPVADVDDVGSYEAVVVGAGARALSSC